MEQTRCNRFDQEGTEIGYYCIFFSCGIYDYTTSYILAKDYFEKLQAPMKGFFTFEQSADSPLFEEPKKMQHILQEDILVGVNNLADTRRGQGDR